MYYLLFLNHIIPFLWFLFFIFIPVNKVEFNRILLVNQTTQKIFRLSASLQLFIRNFYVFSTRFNVDTTDNNLKKIEPYEHVYTKRYETS